MTEKKFIKKYQSCINETVDKKIYYINIKKKKNFNSLFGDTSKKDSLLKYKETCLPNLLKHLKEFNNTIIHKDTYDSIKNKYGSSEFVKDLANILNVPTISITPSIHDSVSVCKGSKYNEIKCEYYIITNHYSGTCIKP